MVFLYGPAIRVMLASLSEFRSFPFPSVFWNSFRRTDIKSSLDVWYSSSVKLSSPGHQDVQQSACKVSCPCFCLDQDHLGLSTTHLQVLVLPQGSLLAPDQMKAPRNVQVGRHYIGKVCSSLLGEGTGIARTEANVTGNGRSICA